MGVRGSIFLRSTGKSIPGYVLPDCRIDPPKDGFAVANISMRAFPRVDAKIKGQW